MRGWACFLIGLGWFLAAHLVRAMVVPRPIASHPSSSRWQESTLTFPERFSHHAAFTHRDRPRRWTNSVRATSKNNDEEFRRDGSQDREEYQVFAQPAIPVEDLDQIDKHQLFRIQLDPLPVDPRMMDPETIRRVVDYLAVMERWRFQFAFTLASWEMRQLYLGLAMDRLARFVPQFKAMRKMEMDTTVLFWLSKAEGLTMPKSMVKTAQFVVERELTNAFAEMLKRTVDSSSTTTPIKMDAIMDQDLVLLPKPKRPLSSGMGIGELSPEEETEADREFDALQDGSDDPEMQDLQTTLKYKRWEKSQIKSVLEAYPIGCQDVVERGYVLLSMRHKTDVFPDILQWMNDLRRCDSMDLQWDLREGTPIFDPWEWFYVAERYFTKFKVPRKDQLRWMAYLTYFTYSLARSYRAERAWPLDVLQLLQEYECNLEGAECQWIAFVVRVQSKLRERIEARTGSAMLFSGNHVVGESISDLLATFDRSLKRSRPNIDQILNHYHRYSLAQWNAVTGADHRVYIPINIAHYIRLVTLMYRSMDHGNPEMRRLIAGFGYDAVHFGLVPNFGEWKDRVTDLMENWNWFAINKPRTSKSE